MALTAGLLSQVSIGSNSVSLVSTTATLGTAPYTQQWYRSTTSGFTPGGGNLIAGATALALNDAGLIPNTPYFYKVVYTDDVAATVTSAELAVTTAAPSQSQNQFVQSPYLGMIDMRFPVNTVSVLIDASEMGTLYAGTPVKMVDSAGGVPKVVKCDNDADSCLGFINYSVKDVGYKAGQPAEISMSGNVMFLYATTAVPRGSRVCLDLVNNGVQVATGATGADVVGWAYDKATAPGDIIRVYLENPSFTLDA